MRTEHARGDHAADIPRLVRWMARQRQPRDCAGASRIGASGTPRHAALHSLGYRKSHAFTMKNTSGRDIYDMIFTSDHDVGDRIMRHLYGKSLAEHEEMRQHALALRREKRRAAETGEVALFPVTPDLVGPSDVRADQVYSYEPPREPYRLPGD